ncbi:hypothetical protein GS399_10155 [Pedobacter sp. HMF7647]|uniref:Uncharacterized protein n=1 Tax=Hufsiella arboris TaxID=2695275 RepID=A0A7K1YAD4_9SPHI|nr:hypothetical protein [Hufsiella arboris]MXV51331.1 hypothetical protein [Hufsiella arboris]
MKRSLTIFILIVLSVFKSFGQTNSNPIIAEHYKTKKFDTAIFPASSLDMDPGKRFTPNKEEINRAETNLNSDLKDLNKNKPNQSPATVIHEKLRKYKRQYFGYTDQNGNRILLINCFWSKIKEFNERWLNEKIVVFDGGSYFWQIKFNLDTNELFELYVNDNP